MLRPLAHTPTYGAADECVEDSEPERVELRKKQRKTSSQRRATEYSAEEHINARPPTSSRLPNAKQRTSIIEISDDSDSDNLLSHKFMAKGAPSGVQTVRKVNEEASSSKLGPLLGGNTPSTSQADVPPKGLDLGRFAFTNPVASRKVMTLPMHTPTLPGPSSKDGGLAPPNTAAALNISLSDLTKISRCVCCDLPWTARKTSIQKMAHIRSCAKKHKYTDETVRILVQKEVDKFVPVPALKKGKEKELPLAGLPSKNTYMEDILVTAAPRKKAKGNEFRSHVANISETRASTLNRAQQLLFASNDASNIHPLTYSAGPPPKFPGTDEENTLGHMNQSFGKSILGQLQGATSKPLFSISSPPPSPTRASSPPIDLFSPAGLTSNHNDNSMMTGGYVQ
ncbi:hypothetical protein HYPSUDRAFT_196428 [Hypholoma sublateritium FD-334 SS-4]|uniref:Uncharacterized protein n=1 Tax=Hypholoma sublateritium (strain FD-334 SS-4) TaxID=945553 RepID=A0A0D2QF21_HYPSF|nr:hypothetical protein HYPSUDRAFT_196428 [Hypholoma sublateritium FD-334 SS-4]